MAKKRDTDPKDGKTQDQKALSRRDFVKKGAAASVGAAVLSTSGTALSQTSPAAAIQWDYEADIVILGAGCTGLPAAIRVRDLGASVIIVDQNFDCGGKMLHSGGLISLGGGDPLQLRDIAGEEDPEGFVTAPPLHSVEELTEDPDFLFRDHTDWSVMDGAAQAPYRYNERELHRAYADNCYATREFLMANYVRSGPDLRHARQWRHVARSPSGDLPDGRSDDGHQEGNRLKAGCRNRGRELESFRATADG